MVPNNVGLFEIQGVISKSGSTHLYGNTTGTHYLQCLKIMKKWTKVVIIVVPVVLVIAAGLVMATPQRICALRSGKFLVGSRCEYAAKDAGKKCVYDADCSKRLCIYPTSSTRPYPQDLSTADGRCTKYNGDKNGEQFCHRPKNGTATEKLLYGDDGNVRCDISVF